jgi:hypothetical protein
MREGQHPRRRDLMEYEASLRFVFCNDPKGVDLQGRVDSWERSSN